MKYETKQKLHSFSVRISSLDLHTHKRGTNSVIETVTAKSKDPYQLNDKMDECKTFEYGLLEIRLHFYASVLIAPQLGCTEAFSQWFAKSPPFSLSGSPLICLSG